MHTHCFCRFKMFKTTETVCLHSTFFHDFQYLLMHYLIHVINMSNCGREQDRKLDKPTNSVYLDKSQITGS